MNLQDFNYSLPKELIAQQPSKKRDESRLMILSDNAIEHKTFRDIVGYLEKGDVLILNEAKVSKVRLLGRKDSGSSAEVVVEEILDDNTCKGHVKTRNPMVGNKLLFGSEKAEIVENIDGYFTLQFENDIRKILKKQAVLPTPYYVKQKFDLKRYQTVFSSKEGSLAAPTAGLHFSKELLAKLKKKGVKTVKINLNIGFGTFTPVTPEQINAGKLHTEYFEISMKAASEINRAKRAFAVGTTVVRAIESSCKDGKVIAGKKGTDLFIHPGYKFKFNYAGLVTNFHLPMSSLLMLVCAFAGKERILEAYRIAVEKKYRFFSLGDAMFILK